ncbi:MAG: hypothetical protein M1570_12280 [Chloroflexi bacterium]|nr:hypothetical protein [Chloroflexota bacterium]
MSRRLLLTLLLACLALQPCLAARRRGAKIYPDKETTTDMAGMNRVFVGWVDFRDDDYAAHGYSSKPEWAAKVVELNNELLRLCQGKYLVGKAVTGAKQMGDEGAAGNDLYIKFSDVLIDYNKYHLVLAIHFIDPKTNSEIGSLPARPYFGNDWGLVNYLKAALDEVGQKIKVEVVGGDQQKKKKKIPLIRR